MVRKRDFRATGGCRGMTQRVNARRRCGADSGLTRSAVPNPSSNPSSRKTPYEKTSAWNGRRLGGMSLSAGSAVSPMPMAASCISDAVSAARWSACRMRRSPWISSNAHVWRCWLGPRRPRRGLAEERDGGVASPADGVDPSGFRTGGRGGLCGVMPRDLLMLILSLGFSSSRRGGGGGGGSRVVGARGHGPGEVRFYAGAARWGS